jgi:hypothetical protein
VQHAADADVGSDGDADPNLDPYGNGDGNRHIDGYPHTDGDGDSHAHPDGHEHADRDADPNAHPYAIAHADVNPAAPSHIDTDPGLCAAHGDAGPGSARAVGPGHARRERPAQRQRRI